MGDCSDDFVAREKRCPLTGMTVSTDTLVLSTVVPTTKVRKMERMRRDRWVEGAMVRGERGRWSML